MRALFRNRMAVQALSGDVAVAIDDLITANNIQPVEVGEAKIRSGVGSPEGRVVGNPGDLYLRTDGGSDAVTYVKDTGKNTMTGWAPNNLTGDGSIPGTHHVSHETGGSDEITSLSASVITSGTLADARLSANVPLINQANTFTAINTFYAANPQTHFYDTAAALDQKRWRFLVVGGAFYLDQLNDAGSAYVAPSFLFERGTGRLVLGGGQIGFPATPAPAGDPNTLDDYAEGSWTPTLTTTGGSTPTYAARGGTYTKIGKAVFIEGRITLSLLVGPAGTVQITGLPFICGGNHSTIQVGYGTTATAGVWLGGYVSAGSTTVVLNFKTAASTSWATGLTAADAGSGFDILFSLHYQAAT